MRIILLVDMDYFYVACEEIKRPELKGKPTIVGAEPKEGRGRGVVMTCNYPARKYGIYSGMPISTAYKLKPDANYLTPDFSYYDKKSAEVMAIFKDYTDKLEQVSIDEAYLDISARVKGYEEALQYAEEIKARISKETKLPCSIGISSNKLIAKMACDACKPNGIKLVREEAAKAFIKDMPIDKLHGVGKKTGERLTDLGYKTIGDIAKANIMHIMEPLGSSGVEIHHFANAIDDREIEGNYEVKSIGREKTFEKDTTDINQIKKALKQLSEETAKDVNQKKLFFKTVTLKLRYNDFTEHTKTKGIRPSNSAIDIEENALQLFKFNAEKERKIRKIGVRVSDLTKYEKQKSLF